MPLNSTDINRIRLGGHTAEERVALVTPRVVVATARVDGTPTAYPLMQIPVTDTSEGWTDFDDGMLVLIGSTPGGHDITVGVTQTGTTSSILQIDEKSFGDGGISRESYQPIVDGDYVTVLKFWPVWSRLSRIRNAQQFKMGNIPYAGQNSNYPPVVNIGAWQWHEINPLTGTAVFTLDAMPEPEADEIDRRSFAYGGKTLDAFLWGIDGLTLLDGYALTDSQIEVEASPGWYVITCTGTDSKGAQGLARSYVWVTDPAGGQHTPFSRSRQVVISSDKSERERKGREQVVTIYGDTTDLFPGAGWLYVRRLRYAGQRLSVDVMNESFCGYIVDRQIEHSRSSKGTRITVQSPLRMWDALGTPPQLIKEARAPKDWQQIAPAFSNVGAITDHVLRWHIPAILQNHDFVLPPGYEVYRKFSFELSATSIGGQLALLEVLAMGNIGSLDDGTTLFSLHPCFMQAEQRNALPVLWTWTGADFTGALTITRRDRSVVRWAVVYAITHNGAEPLPFAARAPGGAAAQGVAEPSIPITIAPAVASPASDSTGQMRVREISGHLFARDNRGILEITLTANRLLDIAQVADLTRWHRLSVTHMGETYDLRMLPVAVNRQWSGRRETLSITFQPEWSGLPGEVLPLERGGAGFTFNFNLDWILNLRNVYRPRAPQFDLPDNRFATGLAINRAGLLGRTQTLLDDAVRWLRVNGLFFGRARDLAFDPASEYLTSSYTTGATGVWLITEDGANGHIYYIDDIRAAEPEATLVHSVSAVNSNIWFRIFTAPSVAGYIVAGWKDSDRSYVVRSTDDGETWGTISEVGDLSTGEGHPDTPLGMAVSDNRVVVIAPSGDVDDAGFNEYALFYSPNAATAFSKVANQPDGWRVVPGCLQMAGGVVYAALERPWTPPEPLGVVTFDVGGYSDYSIGGGPSVGEGAIPGYPEAGDAAFATTNVPLSALSLAVTVNLDAEYNVSAVSFKRMIEVASGNHIYLARIYYYSGDTLIKEAVVENVEFSSVSVPSGLVALNEVASEDVPDQPVTRIGVRIDLSWDGGAEQFIDAFIDDIDITGELIELDYERRVYSVSGLDITPVWADRGNDAQRVPEHHYALAFDPTLTTRLELIGTAPDASKERMAATGGGTAWQTRSGDARFFVGCKRSGDAYLVFGYNEIRLGDNGGDSHYSRTGDWNSAVGPVDIIDGVWVLP